eukprot:1158186-Pelagomonas_calceolata.AAC.2
MRETTGTGSAQRRCCQQMKKARQEGPHFMFAAQNHSVASNGQSGAQMGSGHQHSADKRTRSYSLQQESKINSGTPCAHAPCRARSDLLCMRETLGSAWKAMPGLHDGQNPGRHAIVERVCLLRRECWVEDRADQNLCCSMRLQATMPLARCIKQSLL